MFDTNRPINVILRDHSLNSNSLVVDLGVYRGSWLNDMNRIYNCKCIGLEPIKQYFESAISLPYSNECKIYNAAITIEDSGETEITLSEDGSSIVFLPDSLQKIKIKTINALEFFNSIDQPIDVLQINIEHYEWLLLPYMLQNNLLKNVKAIQIQFHGGGIEDAERKMYNIIHQIENQGFTTKFHSPFIWYGAERIH